jgi:hypothetical protein
MVICMPQKPSALPTLSRDDAEGVSPTAFFVEW